MSSSTTFGSPVSPPADAIDPKKFSQPSIVSQQTDSKDGRQVLQTRDSQSNCPRHDKPSRPRWFSSDTSQHQQRAFYGGGLRYAIPIKAGPISNPALEIRIVHKAMGRPPLQGENRGFMEAVHLPKLVLLINAFISKSALGRMCQLTISP